MRPARGGARRAPIIIRRRKLPPTLPPLRTPLEAVLVAIDSAKRSGYATYLRGVPYAYGEINATKRTERAGVIADAVALAYRHAIPCALVIEVPWGGRNAMTVMSLAETARLWRDSWDRAGQCETRCLQRTAGQWRRAFGWGSLPREQVRALELALARQVVERVRGPEYPEIGPDAAAALCIGQTITRAREMLAVLGSAATPRKG